MAQRKTIQGQQEKSQTPPQGCELFFSLKGRMGWNNWMGRPSWSPDGRFLAVGGGLGYVDVWDSKNGELVHSFEYGNTAVTVSWAPDSNLIAASGLERVQIWDVKRKSQHSHWELYDDSNCVAWSPVGYVLAIAEGGSITLYDAQSGQRLRLFEGPPGDIFSLAWSHDGQKLASSARDNSIRIWHSESTKALHVMRGHRGDVLGIAWAPDDRSLASASKDSTLRIWEAETGRQTDRLEGHASGVTAVGFSNDGRVLASRGMDTTVRLWRTDTWDQIAVLPTGAGNSQFPGLEFHPKQPLLGVSDDTQSVQVWSLDLPVLMQAEGARPAAHYSNAKVVLVGNSGVGKSGLSLVLAGRKFQATESTHARQVWMLRTENATINEGIGEVRETLLWDLAGQPGYRLLHQLHLDDVAVALVLFDAQSELDPFAGVPYWAQALDEATRGQSVKKFLVASRVDRGGPKVSQARIDEVRRRYGFDEYFETSAKRRDGVEVLRDAIFAAIWWDKLPRVSTTELFMATRTFLMAQRKRGVTIATQSELLARFRRKRKTDDANAKVFASCLRGLESAGVIRRLAFGQYILLQPELLDDYCGWLIFAARKQPDGLGYIQESDVISGHFPMNDDRPLKGKEEEKIILLATMQEIVSRNIAYRQETGKGTMLVFPSELNTEFPEYPDGYELTVRFRFKGPISAIHATLTVTLINSLVFKKKELFKNVALFEGPQEQVCGVAMDYPDKSDDSLGRLTVFFEPNAAADVRLLFMRFVSQQLKRLALENTVRRERNYYCVHCNLAIPSEFANRRIQRRDTTVICPVCGQHQPIDERAVEIDAQDEALGALGAQADEERERQTRLTILDERRRAKEFDVFLCHSSQDKPLVRQLAKKLEEHGLLAWMDEKGILAGEQFLKKLERTLDQAEVLAVLIGPHGLGQYQEVEYYAALRRSIEERDESGRPRLRLIPVLLPGVGAKPQLPTFLRMMNFIDLREQGPDNREQMRKFIEAVTAKSDG